MSRNSRIGLLSAAVIEAVEDAMRLYDASNLDMAERSMRSFFAENRDDGVRRQFVDALFERGLSLPMGRDHLRMLDLGLLAYRYRTPAANPWCCLVSCFVRRAPERVVQPIVDQLKDCVTMVGVSMTMPTFITPEMLLVGAYSKLSASGSSELLSSIKRFAAQYSIDLEAGSASMKLQIR